MNRQITILAPAELEIKAAAGWYNDLRAGLGLELTIEIRAAIQRAAEHPRSCSHLRKQPEIRRASAHRFPYHIFFFVEPDKIVVFAVLHSARHDREWKKRV
jgi:toxin ParE1/3/4